VKRYHKLLLYILLIFVGSLTIFPFLWMVATSFKTMGEVLLLPPS